MSSVADIAQISFVRGPQNIFNFWGERSISEYLLPKRGFVTCTRIMPATVSPKLMPESLKVAATSSPQMHFRSPIGDAGCVGAAALSAPPCPLRAALPRPSAPASASACPLAVLACINFRTMPHHILRIFYTSPSTGLYKFCSVPLNFPFIFYTSFLPTIPRASDAFLSTHNPLSSTPRPPLPHGL